MIAKDKRDVATFYLPGFFLKIERKDGHLLLLKLKRELALLLVESDLNKWRKRLFKENGKWSTCVVSYRGNYGTMNVDLFACKKLVQKFKS